MPETGPSAVWSLSDDELDRLQSSAEAGIVDIDSRRLLELVQRVRAAEANADDMQPTREQALRNAASVLNGLGPDRADVGRVWLQLAELLPSEQLPTRSGVRS